MYETLNNVGLNVIINSILFMLGTIYSTITFQDYQQEKSRQNMLFFCFELFGTLYLFLLVVELLVANMGANEGIIFVLSFIRVLAAVIMYTSAGDYILLMIEKKHKVSKQEKIIVHWGLLLLFFSMPCIYWATQNSLLTNLPIFTYLLFLEVVVIRYWQALSLKNKIIYTLLILPTLLLTIQEYWNHTLANVYVVLIMIIIHCEIQQRQKLSMLEIETKMMEQKNELVEARLSLKSSQINPHFLFNTLSSIASLCESNGVEARYLTLELASYMRIIADDLDALHTIPFAKELTHTEHYLNIERVRFGDRLQLDFDIEEMDFRLPPLTLQPLVENAIKHGIFPRDGGLVAVETDADEAAYYIRIIDDGVGFDMEQVSAKSGGLGISNVSKRLEYMCGGTLSISSEKRNGTMAEVRIPKWM